MAKSVESAANINDINNEVTAARLLADAKVVLDDFARKADERQRTIAANNSAITKLSNANKEIVEDMTRAAKRKADFIKAFDKDGYAALANPELVLSHVAKKIGRIS